MDMVAQGAQFFPCLGAFEQAEFLQPVELVQHGPVFVGLLQRIEQCRKQARTQHVLQFAEAQHELIDVLHGVIVEIRQRGGAERPARRDGGHGMAHMVAVAHGLPPHILHALLMGVAAHSSTPVVLAVVTIARVAPWAGASRTTSIFCSPSAR